MTVTIGQRELLATLGGAAATWPLAARAQQPDRIRRLGVLMGLYRAMCNKGKSWQRSRRSFRNWAGRMAGIL